MTMRIVLTLVAVAGVLSGVARENPYRVRPLANDFTVVYASEDPTNVFCYTPGICRLDGGRLVVTCDLGGPKIVGSKVERGRVFVSDDHGVTWRQTGKFPLHHARPFESGGRLYILGQEGDLGITCSLDGGDSWSPLSRLTNGEKWHQSACNVWKANGCVYLVMERKLLPPDGNDFGWGVNRLAPVLMRAKETDDLMKRESWTFAGSFHFDSIFDGDTDPEFDGVGIPWYTAYTAFRKGRNRPADVPDEVPPIGWLETNVVQIKDPDHVWYDPSGHTFHLFMRANTSGSGYAALAKVVENPDGSMETDFVRAPSGVRILFAPFPGGQMRFHVLWDEKTRLYWLLSTQATDTCCRHDRMPKDRYNLPYDERQRLQLLFSRNMIDWCFAGLVAAGETVLESRHYASMCVDGEDLVLVSRSGDKKAKSPHNVDMITFHRISDFRSLVY